MGSLTEGQRKQEEQIKDAIMRGYRAGKCDKDGNSVVNEHGVHVAKPRNITPTKRKVFKRR